MPSNGLLEKASVLLVEEKFYDQNVVALITHSILDQIRLPGCVLESFWWANSETLIYNPISPRFLKKYFKNFKKYFENFKKI